MKHLNITIKGRVQGVGFRYSALQKAREMDINGFIRNTSGGDVYMEIEGDHDQVDQFLSWCYQGPPMAHIQKVDYQESDFEGFRDFRILH